MRRHRYFVIVMIFFSLGIIFHPTGKGNLKENNHMIFAFPGNASLHV